VLIAEAIILTLTRIARVAEALRVTRAGNQLSSIGAAVEHTVVVTAGAPLILTA
jgi:hypothetical protein